jgi:hypothetical protein
VPWIADASDSSQEGVLDTKHLVLGSILILIMVRNLQVVDRVVGVQPELTLVATIEPLL